MELENKNDVNSRWAYIAYNYNQYRLSPPVELIEWLVGMACHGSKPELLVDIGCGTGLSTRPWTPFVQRIIGIDPSEELLSVASSQNQYDHVSYQKGVGSDTGFNNKSVDIVTAMHSIHWMEPVSTLAEVSRVLNNKGMFIIYGHELSPTSLFLELDHELFILKKNIGNYTQKYEIEKDISFLRNPEFAQFTHDKELFQYFRYFYFSQRIFWDAENYVGWIYTLGNVQKLLKDVGLSEEEIGLTRFAEVIKRFFKSEKLPLLVSWRVFLFMNPFR